MFENLGLIDNVPSFTEGRKQALTLGVLSNQLQVSDMDLQQRQQLLKMMQDPRFAQAMSGALSGEPGGDWGGLFQSYPAAAGPAFKQQIDVAKSLVDMQKDRAEMLTKVVDARVKGLGILSNITGKLGAQESPITAAQDAIITGQASAAGMPRELLLTKPPISDQRAYKEWAQTVGSLSTSIKDQTDIWATQAKTPAEVQAKVADAWKSTVDAYLAPQKVGNETMNAQTDRAKYLAGNTQTTNAGTVMQTRPTSIENPNAVVSFPQPQHAEGEPMATNPQEQAAYQAAKDIDARGGEARTVVPAKPVQAGYSPQQMEQIKGTGEVVNEMQKSIPAAAQGLQYIADLRALDAQGIYGGGIKGTDYFKRIANIVASTPFASKEMVERLANTQVWEKDTGNVIIQTLRQLPGNRLTNNELQFISNVNPQTIQQPQARQRIYDTIERGLKNSMEFAQSASQYAVQPGVTNLSGWQAPGVTQTMDRNKILQDALNAINKGADRKKVAERLESMGIKDHGF